MPTKIALLWILLMGCGAVWSAENSIADQDVHKLREWNALDPQLFNILFMGVHEGTLDIGKLPEEQFTHLGLWQREAPQLFLRLYSVSWPEAIQPARPARKRPMQLTDEVPTFSI